MLGKSGQLLQPLRHMQVVRPANARVIEVLLNEESVDIARRQRPFAAIFALEDLALGEGSAGVLERQAVTQLGDAGQRHGQRAWHEQLGRLGKGQFGHVHVVDLAGVRVGVVLTAGETAAAAAVDAAAARVKGP
jgi:hypothetical protein